MSDNQSSPLPVAPTGSLLDPLPEAPLTRPKAIPETPPPPMPEIDTTRTAVASGQYALHNTNLATLRTALAGHRTALAEYRTNLSTRRTNLSTRRTDMSMRRTGMSFQRTRMSADRTLMSVIRTSLSLISFGFTIFQVFQKLREQNVVTSASAERHFGIALAALGIVMLILGIVYHSQFMLGLRRTRGQMKQSGVIYGESGFPPSMTLITAVILLVIGLAAVISMVFKVGPFG